MSDTRHILHHDIETRSRIDLKRVGAVRYADHASTEALCLGFAVDDEPVKIWSMWNNDPVPPEFIEAAHNPLWLTASHNDHFERSIAKYVLGPQHGFPEIPIERRRCSMAMTYAAALPGALEKAIAALGLPFEKDKAGQALMRRMSKPRPDGSWIEDEASRERLYQYVRHDVESERAVFKALPPLIDAEQKLWVVDAGINERGVAIDVPLLEAALRIVTEAQAKFQTEFRALTDLDSTNQVEKFIAWLATNDCVVTDAQKDTLKHALRRKGLTPKVRRAIELRLELAHASTAKVEALLNWRGADNRVRGSLVFHGASTGRWASRGVGVQNFKRDSTGIDTKIASILNGGAGLVSPVEDVGAAARAMICAAAGHRLLIGDFSGIESRVLAWISAQASKLEQWAKFDRTGDPKDEPYYILGRACGQPEETARTTGKTADLAFGYCGGPKAWDRLAPEDDTSSEEDKRRYQQTWRKMHQQTVAFWGGINRAAINAVGKPGTTFNYKSLGCSYDGTFLRIVLPSGRALSYPFPRLGTGKFGDAMILFKDNAAGKWVDCRFGQGSFGGLWAENLTQAISRDLLAAALMRLEAAGYPVTLHVHDEIVCEVPNGFGSLEEFQRLITTLPDWAASLPIAAKVRESDRFAKITEPAISEGCLGSDPLEIMHPQPSVSVECEDGHRAPVENTPNPANTGTPAGNANDGNDAGDNYASGEQPRGHSTAVYIYRDANGAPYLRVVRSSAKKFWQSHWDNGRWLKGKPAGPKIPYRLPELVAAAANISVFVCEGEKDADNVATLGSISTTNSEGAGKGKWTVDLNKWFAGKQLVYILEDNDDDGRRHAREVAGHLQHLVDEIHIVSFPELPVKGDVSDWLEAGGTREQLLARAKAAPRWQRDGYVLVRASDIVPRAMDWLWQGHILRGSQELLTGIPGNGKSQIHCAFVAYVTTGGAWPDGCNGAPPGNVIMMTAEDCLDHHRAAPDCCRRRSASRVCAEENSP